MLLALPCRLLPVARTVGRQLARVVVTLFSAWRETQRCVKPAVSRQPLKQISCRTRRFIGGFGARRIGLQGASRW